MNRHWPARVIIAFTKMCFAVQLFLGATSLCHASHLARVPMIFTIDLDLPCVRVNVAGKGYYNFLVDTGSTCSTVFTETARALNIVNDPDLDVRSMDPDNLHARSQAAMLPFLQVGKIKIPSVLVAISSKNVMQLHCDGILGLDVLAKYVITLDFDESALVIDQGIPSRKAGTAIRLDRKLKNIATFNANVDGQKLQLKLDTGCRGHIACDQGRLNSLQTQQPFRTTNLLGLDGFHRSGEFMLKYLSVGSFNLRNVPAIGVFGPKPRPGSDILIGIYFARRFKVTIDLTHGVMYLKPGRSIGEQFCYMDPGMKLGQYSRITVAHGSPAYTSGLRSGDVLIALDGNHNDDNIGIPISVLTASPVGRKCCVEVMRNGKPRNFTIVCRANIPAPPRTHLK